MSELLKLIQSKIDLIESRLTSGMAQDSIECDQLLGDLAASVQDARELIDTWWRANRHSVKHIVKRDLSEIDLGDLGL